MTLFSRNFLNSGALAIAVETTENVVHKESDYRLHHKREMYSEKVYDTTTRNRGVVLLDGHVAKIFHESIQSSKVFWELFH